MISPVAIGTRCPECGHIVFNARLAAELSFFDPRRVSTLLAMALLLAAQIVLPLIFDERYSTSASAHVGFIGNGMSVSGFAAVANGDERGKADIELAVDSLLSPYQDADPAATLTVKPAFDLTMTGGEESIRSVGWPKAWVTLARTTEPYYDTDSFKVLWATGSYASVAIHAPSDGQGNLRADIRFSDLVFNLATVVGASVLLSKMLRPTRVPWRRWVTTPRILAAGLLAGLAASAVVGASVSQARGSKSWSSLVPPAVSNYTLSDAIGLRGDPLRAQRFARTVVDIALPSMGMPEGSPSAFWPPDSPVQIEFVQKTDQARTDWQAGWPARFLWGHITKSGSPAGTAPVAGRTMWHVWSGSVSLSVNAGAWPGTSWGFGLDYAQLVYDVLIAAAILLLVRLGMMLPSAVRARKRFRNGKCVRCGYELIGLGKSVQPSGAAPHSGQDAPADRPARS